MKLAKLILILIALSFGYANEVQAKSCWWLGLTSAKRLQCECEKLGYQSGTTEFLQCYQVVGAQLQQQAQEFRNLGQMLGQQQQQRQQNTRQCVTTRVGNSLVTNCY